MREFRTYGSVRGAPSNGRPYRDPLFQMLNGALWRDTPRPFSHSAEELPRGWAGGEPSVHIAFFEHICHKIAYEADGNSHELSNTQRAERAEASSTQLECWK